MALVASFAKHVRQYTGQWAVKNWASTGEPGMQQERPYETD
jgi:hypothetical protein